MSDERNETIAEIETRMRQKMRLHSKPLVSVTKQPQPQPTVQLFPTLLVLASTAGVSWLCKRWFER